LDVSVELASQCKILTSVASTDTSLLKLDNAIKDKPGKHHMLNLDWESSAFSNSLNQHVQSIGYPGLVLVWLHKDALIPKVALAISTDKTACSFYHVRESAAADPAQQNGDILAGHQLPKSFSYHQIILGFHIENGVSRWLANSEISNGVGLAIENSIPDSIIGTVRPWSLRP